MLLVCTLCAGGGTFELQNEWTNNTYTQTPVAPEVVFLLNLCADNWTKGRENLLQTSPRSADCIRSLLGVEFQEFMLHVFETLPETEDTAPHIPMT